MDTVLDVKNLTKTFGQFTAVDDISFSIKEGEIVGLLGPNGAGKTTTIQMLLGLTTPTAGTIQYFGKDFFSNRADCLADINFASAYTHLQGKMTVYQDLEIMARLYGVKNWRNRIEELASLFDIQETLGKLFWQLSSGQKTRVVLAKSLINHPKLILMDEPTASLDLEIVDKVLDLIVSLQKTQRVAILYTSHNMTEVERICDRVMFLFHGKIVAEDTPLGFTKRIGESRLTVTYDAEKKDVVSYLTEEGISFTSPRNHVVEITLSEKDIPKVLFGFSSRKIWVTEIRIDRPSLEDVFLTLAKGDHP